MDEFINGLLETYLGQMIDKSRDELIMADEICRQDESDLKELEEQYKAIKLSEADRRMISDYLDCMEAAAHRNADLSYIAGVKDTIRILHSLDLLKGMENQGG